MAETKGHGFLHVLMHRLFKLFCHDQCLLNSTKHIRVPAHFTFYRGSVLPRCGDSNLRLRMRLSILHVTKTRTKELFRRAKGTVKARTSYVAIRRPK